MNDYAINDKRIKKLTAITLLSVTKQLRNGSTIFYLWLLRANDRRSLDIDLEKTNRKESYRTRVIKLFGITISTKAIDQRL